MRMASGESKKDILQACIGNPGSGAKIVKGSDAANTIHRTRRMKRSQTRSAI